MIFSSFSGVARAERGAGTEGTKGGGVAGGVVGTVAVFDFGTGKSGASNSPVRAFSTGSGLGSVGARGGPTASGFAGAGTDGTERFPVWALGFGKGGGVSAPVLAFGGTGGTASWPVLPRDGGRGGGVRLPVVDFEAGSGGTPDRRPVRTLGGGSGTPPSAPVRFAASTGDAGIGADFFLSRDEAAIPIGWVTATGFGAGGSSTSFNEPVSRFDWTGTGVPSGATGRPGEAITPLLASGVGGSGAVREGTLAVGGRGENGGKMGGAVRAGAGDPSASCGATGSGAFGASALASREGGGMVATGSGGGVTGAFGAGEGSATGGALGASEGSVGATALGGRTPGSDWVAGNAGGRDWCGIGSKSSFSSTLPLWIKILALGFAMTTRGGAPGSRPEGMVTGGAAGAVSVSPDEGGSAMAPLPTPSAKGLVGGFFFGKSGVVFAAAEDPVRGGAAERVLVSGGDGVRVMLGIGLVTAVDHEGGRVWTGAGTRFGEVLIGSVVAAETLGRGVTWLETGFSGRGGKLTRKVSRFGGVGFELSGLAGVSASAISDLFIVISEMFNREISDGNIFLVFGPYKDRSRRLLPFLS
jgi:hypothetical protein